MKLRFSVNKNILLFVGLLSLALPTGSSQKMSGHSDFPCFVDVAAKQGIDFQHVGGSPQKRVLVEQMSGGAAFFDYDQDGWLDIYLVNGTTIERYQNTNQPLGPAPTGHLYRNKGDGSFEDVTNKAGVGKPGWGMGVCVGDYNNDGYPDLFVTNYGHNVLYRNNGDGTFTDVTRQAGLEGTARWGTGCAFGDYDLDGFLDLYVANYAEVDLNTPPIPCQYYEGMQAACSPRGLPGQNDILYRNLGNGTFKDVTREAGIKDDYYGLGVTFADFNNDGLPDIYVADDITPNLLYLNRGDGTFREVGAESGSAFNMDGVAQAGMGLAVGDYDNDGWLDIFVTNFAGQYSTLFHNDGKGSFSDVTVKAGLARISMPFVKWGTGFFDFDNDGFRDLFQANGHVAPVVEKLSSGMSYTQPSQFFKNIRGKAFQEVPSPWCDDRKPEKVSRGAAFGDYDNDGDIDILVNNMDDRPMLLRNEGGNRKRFLEVRALTQKGHRDAIGARIAVRAGSAVQIQEILSGSSYLSQNDLRAHFGLGTATAVNVEVKWLGGKREVWENVSTNRLIVVREGEGRPVSNNAAAPRSSTSRTPGI
jgi:hypothetical protein